MKRLFATLVSALVALAFAGVAAAQQPYGTDTHPPVVPEQPGLKADTGTKAEKKAKKKKKKAAKKAKKEMKEDMGTTGTTAPNATEPPQPPPAR